MKLLKEPLLHFLILGAGIFALYNLVNRDAPSEDEIIVTSGQQEHIINVFSRTWQRPPTQQEFSALIQDHVRQEIAFRQGKAMGLDDGDTIIRRRMRQKLELLTDEIVGLGEPGEEELQQFLNENQERFRMEPVLDVRQIYFSLDRRGESAESDANTALELLRSEEAGWEELGDPLPIGSYFQQVRASVIDANFGAGFLAGLGDLETSGWRGPVRSAYGLHLVAIDNFTPGRDPRLEEVREQVKTEWFVKRRQEATDELYQVMAENYTISIEPLNEVGEG